MGRLSSSSELLLFPVTVKPAGAVVVLALPPELEAVDAVDVAAVVGVVVVVAVSDVVVVVLLVEDDVPDDPLPINGACTKMLAVTVDPVA